MIAASLLPTVEQVITQLYSLRTARSLRADAVAHGDHAEARRHDDRLWSAAEHIRNIIRERPNGIQAYHVARREYRA